MDTKKDDDNNNYFLYFIIGIILLIIVLYFITKAKKKDDANIEDSKINKNNKDGKVNKDDIVNKDDKLKVGIDPPGKKGYSGLPSWQGGPYNPGGGVPNNQLGRTTCSGLLLVVRTNSVDLKTKNIAFMLFIRSLLQA